jgi:hypothetical protein
MAAALVLLLTLFMVLVLNRGMFESIGLGRSLQMLLAWAALFAAAVLLLRLFGLA